MYIIYSCIYIRCFGNIHACIRCSVNIQASIRYSIVFMHILDVSDISMCILDAPCCIYVYVYGSFYRYDRKEVCNGELPGLLVACCIRGPGGPLGPGP